MTNEEFLRAMKPDKDTPGQYVGGCLLLILAAPFGVLARGYALSVLWFWFIVPMGIRPITIAHAVGIGLVLSLFNLTKSGVPKRDPDESFLRHVYGIVFAELVGPFLVVAIGWLIHGWMLS